MTWILILSFGLFFGAIIGLIDAFANKFVQNPIWESLPRFLTLASLIFTLSFLEKVLYPNFGVTFNLASLAVTLLMIVISASFVNVLVYPKKL